MATDPNDIWIGQCSMLPDEQGSDESKQDSRRASKQAQHDGFAEELELDGTLGRSHRHANSNFPGALRDRYQHDVHDADSAHQQRNRGDRDQQHAQGPARIELRLNDILGITDIEIVFFLGTQVMAIPRRAADSWPAALTSSGATAEQEYRPAS